MYLFILFIQFSLVVACFVGVGALLSTAAEHPKEFFMFAGKAVFFIVCLFVFFYELRHGSLR